MKEANESTFEGEDPFLEVAGGNGRAVSALDSGFDEFVVTLIDVDDFSRFARYSDAAMARSFAWSLA
jgi:hypothetical protein